MAQRSEDDPINESFWKARGYRTRPSNWEEIYLEHLEAEELVPILTSTTSSFSIADPSVINDPLDERFWRAHGYETRPPNWEEIYMQHLEAEELLPLSLEENRSSLATNLPEDTESEEYWLLRGYEGRPFNWEEIYLRHLEMEELFQNMSINANQSQNNNSSFRNSNTSKVAIADQTNKQAVAISPSSRTNNNIEGNQDLCKICLDKNLDSIILECAHIATCFTCGQRLKECPICRKRISRVVRTYKA